MWHGYLVIWFCIGFVVGGVLGSFLMGLYSRNSIHYYSSKVGFLVDENNKLLNMKHTSDKRLEDFRESVRQTLVKHFPYAA